MRKILTIQFLFLSLIGFGQSMRFIEYTEIKDIRNANDLITGQWIFKELQDLGGNSIDTIYRTSAISFLGKTKEIVNRPDITYKSDGTYFMDFTPENRDEGYWKLNVESNKVIYQLGIDSSGLVGNYLISIGEASRRENGRYYNLVEDEIYHLSKGVLILKEQGDYFQIYIKQ